MNNVPIDPSDGCLERCHLLKLRHKQTRAVSVSRLAEWRAGLRWRLRTPEGNGRTLFNPTILPDPALKRTRAEPEVGTPRRIDVAPYLPPKPTAEAVLPLTGSAV